MCWRENITKYLRDCFFLTIFLDIDTSHKISGRITSVHLSYSETISYACGEILQRFCSKEIPKVLNKMVGKLRTMLVETCDKNCD